MEIGKYNFELKKFNYLESRSEETHCFGATLYVNGKKLAECGNSGQGGSTDVDIFPECRALGNEVEDFLKMQPKIKDEDYEFELNLEYIVDVLVENLLIAKELQKLKKMTESALVFRSPSGDYFKIGWKGSSIESILKRQEGPEAIKNVIAVQVSKGHKLLNENIPRELLPTPASVIKPKKPTHPKIR